MAQRIQFTDEELEVLASWIFMKDSKPQKDHPTDKNIIKKIKNAFLRECMDTEWEYWANDFEKNIIRDDMGIDITEELAMKKDSIQNPQGIFFCPNCKVRTNEKTYKTRCVICDTSLIRGGGL